MLGDDMQSTLIISLHLDVETKLTYIRTKLVFSRYDRLTILRFSRQTPNVMSVSDMLTSHRETQRTFQSTAVNQLPLPLRDRGLAARLPSRKKGAFA